MTKKKLWSRTMEILLFTFPLLTVLPVILIIILVVYVKNVIARMEQRSDKRVEIDRQNAEIQQQQMKIMEELNQRISNVEILLKQVE